MSNIFRLTAGEPVVRSTPGRTAWGQPLRLACLLAARECSAMAQMRRVFIDAPRAMLPICTKSGFDGVAKIDVRSGGS